ncbi:type I glyceraldehyde-3-phosphate dehydrogenase [Caminibacter pacificus]|uniref:Glyceraldehyde-3-phosphate dehydrogenase n=1 Tax=Caminibacter pacificus TaxID=1424653 RepID=A0AAJ4RBS1_9BACT|nr:type I glyceraldehyde-3-phosphate dehydrogenase [Caminibacter pacificus]NPA87956.1 type I glyceraldehyde-3-phosphate dehydrogenase [Campylobacterota bacterium]QCI28817.1 type I glyceraldehyde-3-phosphate dehydrogenase [Caminibacter pacificus]ROR39405.1 glyceraldehyde 3-phosphate dehydrogenase [Caminibacter pacificus]
MKIAINGIGRIGRNVIRALLKRDEFELVAINDIMPIEIAAYLLKHDTIRGNLEDIEVLDSQTLKIGPHFVNYSQKTTPKECDFSEADVVIESTGKFLSFDEVKEHLKGNVKKVIISAPANDDTPTFVYGVNHKEYNGQSVISNASCTTNCLAPIAKIIDEKYSIVSGFMTTIHSYTMDQKLLDAPNLRDIRRSRAAASNIIPTFTGAAKAIYKVLPNLKGKLDGRSVRVPVNNVSLMDLTLQLEKEVKADEINELIEFHAKTDFKGIIGIDYEYAVSSDINGRKESSVFVPDLTQANGKLLKLFAWYDNEWGYSNRLLDMAEYVYKWGE